MALPATDGRRARAERHRRTVVDALLTLIHERGDLPGVDAIASRAEVSKRTVFRLFEDLSSLHVAAVELKRTEVMAQFPPPFPSTEPIDERIRQIVDHRASVYEGVMAVRRVAERLRDKVEPIAIALQGDRKAFRVHIDMVFAQHLRDTFGDEADERLHGVEVATSWNTWHTLRNEQGCSVELARNVVMRMVGDLTMTSGARVASRSTSLVGADGIETTDVVPTVLPAAPLPEA